MSKLQERENRRRSVVGGIIEGPAVPAPAAGSRGRPKEDRELKKRISLSVLPSLYDDIQKIAYVQRQSVSELLSAMMEEYRSNHAAPWNRELERVAAKFFKPTKFWSMMLSVTAYHSEYPKGTT